MSSDSLRQLGEGVLAIGAALIPGVGQWAAIAVTTLSSVYESKRAQEEINNNSDFPTRDVMLTGAKQPQTVIYGEAWVGGVVVYNNQRHTPGSKDNYEVYLGLAHCCHEVDSITDLYFGNDLLVDGVDIDWTAGSVTAGKYGISKSGVYAVDVERQFGTVGQAAPALLTAAFPFDWTSAHTMPGVCSTFYKFTYFSKTATAPEDLFYAGPPQTIRVKIKGRKIYDPRLDSTNGGSGGQRPALESSWTWSDNPILCWVDYMRNYKGIAFAKIDWDWVRTQADVCDVSCPVPVGQVQKRFTCNGAISTDMTHEKIREAILSSCMGSCPKVSGLWRPTAGAYTAASAILDESDVVGTVTVVTAKSRDQRFNNVKATYYDPTAYAQEVDSLPIWSLTYYIQDGAELPQKVLSLPMVNNEFLAQRISYKTLIQGREQITCTVPLKWTGLRIYPGVRVQFTFPPYGWARKIFRCISWEFGGESPVSVVLQSDQAISWRDPTEGTYSHRDEQGTVILGEVEIPSPTAGGGMGGEITARNPGFEFGPVGWLSLDPSTILILKDTSTAHNGDWFARGTANGTYASRNELVMPVVPGQRVRVSGWVKSSADALFDQLRWRGRFMDVNLNLTGAVDAYITDATTTWTQVYAVGEAPAGTEFVALNMSLINKISGQVYWDDGMLEINPGAKLGDDFVGPDGVILGPTDILNNYVPPVVNSLPSNFGDFEAIELSSLTPLNTSVLRIDTTQAYVGTRSLGIVGTAAAGSPWGVFLAPTVNGDVIVDNLFLKPHRRWLVIAAIQPANSSSLGSNITYQFAFQHGTDALTYSQGVHFVAGGWNLAAFQIDEASDNTAFKLVLVVTNTTTQAEAAACWLDAVQLIDVTDKPWYDSDSFPTEYLPGTGSWAQTYAGFRAKLQDETISSDAALGDDAEIKGWKLDPASTYVFDAHIRFNSGATPDLQINFGVTQTVAAFSGWVEQVNAGGASSAWWDGSSLVIAGGAADQSLWIRAAIVTDPTNQSTAAFQWAQNSSNGSNTTVYAGSYGNLIKVK